MKTVEVPDELVERCKAIVEWRDTGRLTANALHKHARRLGIHKDHDALQLAEDATIKELLRLVVRERTDHVQPKAQSRKRRTQETSR